MQFKSIILILSLVLFVIPVQAEEVYNQSHFFSGNIVTEIGTANAENNTGGELVNPSISHIHFDFTTNKLIDYMYLPPRMRPADNLDSSTNSIDAGLISIYKPFTAYVDGTFYGQGNIGYTSYGVISTDYPITYQIIFDTSTIDTTYANSLTGWHNLSFDYDKNVFNVNLAYYQNHNQDINTFNTSAEMVIFLDWTDGTFGDGFYRVWGRTRLNVVYSDTVTVSFFNQSNSFGSLNITKSNVNYQLDAENISGTDLYLNTSTIDISTDLDTRSGVVVNLRHVASGNWNNNTVIGATAPTPTAQPTATPSPFTGGGVVFDKQEYFKNEIANISYNFSETSWYDLAVDRKLDIYGPDGVLHHSEYLPTRVGFFLIQLNRVGNWEARLEKYIKGFPTVLTTYAEDSAYVTEPLQPYFFINNTVPVNKNVTFQFRYGFNPQNGEFRNGIKMFRHNPATNTFELEKYTTILTNDSSAQIGSENIYTDNLSFPRAGNYSLCLYSASEGRCVVDKVKVTAVFDIFIPGRNITRSYINITSGSIYSWNDALIGGYAVDNVNYSAYSISITVTNTNESIETINQVVPDQTGTFTIPIYNTDEYNPADYFNIIGQPWTKLYFIAGSNVISLNATNQTHTIELARDTFTLANTDADGYGLQFNKQSLCQGETLIMTASVPSGIGTLIVDRMDNLRYNLLNVNISGTKTVTFKNTQNTQTLYVALLDSSGTTRFTNNIAVADCRETAVPDAPEQQGSTMYNNLINLMMLPIFWGIVLWNGGILAMVQRRAQNVGLYAFIWGNLLAIAGLFNPYTTYMLVIMWIGAGVYFQVGRRIIGAR